MRDSPNTQHNSNYVNELQFVNTLTIILNQLAGNIPTSLKNSQLSEGLQHICNTLREFNTK